MKKITLLISCLLFVLTTNSIHAQTIVTAEGEGSINNEDQQVELRDSKEKVYVEDESNDQQNENNSKDNEQQEDQNQNDLNSQNNSSYNSSVIQPQRSNLSVRIKQQAKAIREKIMTQINRNSTLSTIRNSKLQNTVDNTRRTTEGDQKIEGGVDNPADNNPVEGSQNNTPTIGQKYRIAFDKLTDIQMKIENAINEVQSSTKIDADKLRQSLQNSRESLANSNEKIQELEKIPANTVLDSEIKSSMSEAKKGLVDSKQYLNNILVALKQATKAKAIIQTGGGNTSGGGTGGQPDGNNGADTGNQPRK